MIPTPKTENERRFDVPRFGIDIGVGYGGPNGGYSRGGVVRTTVVFKDRGPCYQKKVTCPARCFYYFSHSGRGYGGGGCTIDCKNKCTAYC
ncbi:hypothetical protein Ahy_B03g063306 isoform C [Arachis hypogaea]|uniref:Uncharacterized protein n=1 Tax=Arachis hypogaea TaxID=3818 RepID=A0A444ZWY3_ARAHY|nr:hypothetical protein Ahy_B03g063306 isoform C [Arachis hypogaea]